MTDRENLVELLNHQFGKKFSETVADWLLSNGVTIPVRCKECVNRDMGRCNVVTGCGSYVPVSDDFFCRYGKPKEQNKKILMG